MNQDLIVGVVLGLVQGITELLPVSSSAHLIFVSELMSGHPLPLALNVALHVGTVLAVLAYFYQDWLAMGRATVRRITTGTRSFGSDVLLPALVLGSIPAGFIGLKFHKIIEEKLHHPVIVIVPLALVGVLLWWSDKTRPATRSLDQLTIKDGILIGIGQACSLIPGVSRSGSTIIAGRFLGFARPDAARFSFLLGTPAMFGAALLELRDILNYVSDPILYVGTLVSFASGCLAISFMMKFVRNNGFFWFMVYRFAVATTIAIFTLKF
ncbi:undecaprenyl-diphosphate phosphatase [bacterium]|nr:undecaprenyl-diphosphate phosphatase [bacterium]